MKTFYVSLWHHSLLSGLFWLDLPIYSCIYTSKEAAYKQHTVHYEKERFTDVVMRNTVNVFTLESDSGKNYILILLHSHQKRHDDWEWQSCWIKTFHFINFVSDIYPKNGIIVNMLTVRHVSSVFYILVPVLTGYSIQNGHISHADSQTDIGKVSSMSDWNLLNEICLLTTTQILEPPPFPNPCVHQSTKSFLPLSPQALSHPHFLIFLRSTQISAKQPQAFLHDAVCWHVPKKLLSNWWVFLQLRALLCLKGWFL